MTSNKEPQAGSEKKVGNDSPIAIVDFGSHSRKAIKKFKKGEGKLLSHVDELIDGLSSEGKIAKGSTPVVIVVREKAKKKAENPFGF